MSDPSWSGSGVEDAPDGSPRPNHTAFSPENIPADPRDPRSAGDSGADTLQATVEDCPEEYPVVSGTPRPVPQSPNTAMPAAYAPEHSDRPQHQVPASPSREGSLPSFIKISGPHAEQPEALRYLDAGHNPNTPELIHRYPMGPTQHPHPAPATSTVSSHSSAPRSSISEVSSHMSNSSNGYYDGMSWKSSANGYQGKPEYGFHDRQAPMAQHPPSHQPRGSQNGFSQPEQWSMASEAGYASTLNSSPYTTHAMPSMPPNYRNEPIPSHQQQHQPWTYQPQQRPSISGYQYLASRLTEDVENIPKVTPIYRRFAWLSHRLLLQMQDELAELEQDLQHHDFADHQARMGANGPYPASRRAEDTSHEKPGWHKKRILCEVGSRLASYGQLLSSYNKTRQLPVPTYGEVEDYQAFFRNEQAIAEDETRFLDHLNDLVSLAPVDDQFEPPAPMPTSGPPELNGKIDTSATSPIIVSPQMPSPKAFRPNFKNPVRRPQSSWFLTYATLAAIAMPIVSFTVIRGLWERMIVVAVVLISSLPVLLQSAPASTASKGWELTNCVICAGVYGGVMTIAACGFS